MKRYYAVCSKRRGSFVHRMFSATKTEGNLTDCGRPIAAGWVWSTRVELGKPRCKQCYA